MAPNNLPASFNATAQDIEMLLSAQCHIGSKNMQVHMEPYLWKTRPDGINVINIGKTWYVCTLLLEQPHCALQHASPTKKWKKMRI
jgi:small subunit ribosomal protein SAe